MSKICMNCGQELDDSVQFCTNCGGQQFADGMAQEYTMPLNDVGNGGYGVPADSAAMNGGYGAPADPAMMNGGYGAPADPAMMNGGYGMPQPPQQKKGFPLWILIIILPVIIGIVAILIAIVVPTFTAATEKSKERTDLANVRSLKSLVVARYMADGQVGDSNYSSVDCYLKAGGQDYTTDSSEDIILVTAKWPGESYGKGDPILVEFNNLNGKVENTVPAIPLEGTDSFGDESSAALFEDSESGVAYTKGEMKDDMYVNTWAHFALGETDKFKDNPSLHSGYESASTECGFASRDEATGSTLVILFENVSSVGRAITEEEYLDATKKSMDASFAGGNYTIGAYTERTIASSQFLTMKVTLASGVEYVCVRIIDDYAMAMIIAAPDESTITEMLDEYMMYY